MLASACSWWSKKLSSGRSLQLSLGNWAWREWAPRSTGMLDPLLQLDRLGTHPGHCAAHQCFHGLVYVAHQSRLLRLWKSQVSSPCVICPAYINGQRIDQTCICLVNSAAWWAQDSGCRLAGLTVEERDSAPASPLVMIITTVIFSIASCSLHCPHTVRHRIRWFGWELEVQFKLSRLERMGRYFSLKYKVFFFLALSQIK